MQPAPPFIRSPSSLLAPRTGGTTISGSAARCIRRLHRSCKTERDYCHQQNCSNALHGFFSFEKSMWFLSTDGDAISMEPKENFSCGFLNAKQVCFEECVSAVVPNGRNDFDGTIKPNCHQIEIGNQNKSVRRSDAQRRSVGLRGDSHFQRAARHPTSGDRFPVTLFSGSIAGRMVRAIFHVCHRPRLAVFGHILLGGRSMERIGICQCWQRATHEAGQDSHPQRNYCGYPCLEGVERQIHNI